MNQGNPDTGKGDGSAAVFMGEARVFPDRSEVVLGGETHRLKPKVMAVLRILLEAGGEVVGKNELLDRVWPNMAVTDAVLVEAVHELRRALGDDARNPVYVSTVPRRGYRVVAPVRRPVEGRDGRPPRVAVMRFESLGDDSAESYFCEGLCEELISRLGRVDGIEVLARRTTLSLPAEPDAAASADARLGITHVVSGSVRGRGGRLRVVARLLDAATGMQTWSEAFEGGVEDLIELEMSMATRIGDAVAPQLAGEGGGQAREAPAPSSRAFREFSKGRYFWKLDNGNPQRAQACYEAALRLEPDYAKPHAGLVECWNTLAIFHLAPQAACREEAIRHAERALFLAPRDPDILFAFGYAQFYMHWDWAAAETALLKCLSLNPNHALSHSFLCLLYSALRDSEKASHHARRATTLDPLSPVSWLHRAIHHRYFARHEHALERARVGLEINPEDVPLLWLEADSLLRTGRHGEVAGRMGLLEEVTEISPMFHALTGLQYLMLDDEAGFERIEQRLQAHFRERWDDGFVGALLAIGRGREEEAVDRLEQAETAHDSGIWLINCDPLFLDLAGNARLEALRRRLGLPAPF